MSDSTTPHPAALRVRPAFGDYEHGELVTNPAAIAAIYENGQQRMTVAVAAELPSAKAEHTSSEG